MKVTFSPNEFKDLRKFQNAFNKKLGSESYVGCDHATLLVEFSSELKAMLRPYPQELVYEYELRCLTCEDCKCSQPFLCAKDETTYVCWGCLSKREKKKS